MIIYKITCKCQKVYIGSTETTLEQRKKYHFYDFRKERCENKPLYQHIKECCAFDDLIFEELTECDELIRFETEQEYIDTYNSIQEGLNDRRAISDEYWWNDYRIKNKEKIKLYNQNYRLFNSDKIKERKTKTVLCECGIEITHQCLARHRRTKKHLNKVRN